MLRKFSFNFQSIIIFRKTDLNQILFHLAKNVDKKNDNFRQNYKNRSY